MVSFGAEDIGEDWTGRFPTFAALRPVRIVEGERDNFKLTHPEDLERAERWLQKEGR